MECLSIGAEYKRELKEARGQYVQPPLLMAAYNCTTSEDFLAETIKKIRSRYKYSLLIFINGTMYLKIKMETFILIALANIFSLPRYHTGDRL
jgi:hypothetical protein